MEMFIYSSQAVPDFPNLKIRSDSSKNQSNTKEDIEANNRMPSYRRRREKGDDEPNI